jgi:hypothetical protein
MLLSGINLHVTVDEKWLCFPLDEGQQNRGFHACIPTISQYWRDRSHANPNTSFVFIYTTKYEFTRYLLLFEYKFPRTRFFTGRPPPLSIPIQAECCCNRSKLLLLHYVTSLTLILLMWRILWAPNNASRWQMGFNSVFKVLIVLSHNPTGIRSQNTGHHILINPCPANVENMLSS